MINCILYSRVGLYHEFARTHGTTRKEGLAWKSNSYNTTID